MGGHAEAQGTPEAEPEDARRRSRVAADHIGFITNLVVAWKKRGRFQAYEVSELVNISIIEADRLLREKYQPEKATASYFLSRFLVGRVEYTVGKSEGKRKHREGWQHPNKLNPPTSNMGQRPDDIAAFNEIVELIHPDLRPVVIRLASGEELETIARELFEMPIFNSIPGPCQSLDELKAELRFMIKAELKRVSGDEHES